MSLADVGPLLLVGAGRMGSAMLEGWIARGLDPDLTFVIEPQPSDRLRELAETRGIHLNPDPAEGPAPDKMVLAVKPQVMDDVLARIAPFASPSTLVISIAAGRTLEGIARHFPTGTPIVRSIPNTPAAIGKGVTVAHANQAVDEDGRRVCTRLLESLGVVEWVDEEQLIDAATAVSGSGPAYAFYLAECLAEAGHAEGLPQDLAARLAAVTVAGAGALMLESGLPASKLRENVTSPNGTTAAALAVLMREEHGLGALMREAVAAAAARSRQLAT
ncbi:pyrroline-5-carboxylate reductase [Lutibaculum baratangense]|uniref:Pyrroline-5-carboxylate reductase n=1 Tax=Lutibaculum baratangense AMV1 TaxID=631454 RepID=V4QTV9_9HYPH|nr:pyrroline-5-carboxylate reductase [Lutibaculum baratangense]ESR23212.1 Pyrroline-5-carboxylate reductase [Lutibaculum baratangense AMV1]